MPSRPSVCVQPNDTFVSVLVYVASRMLLIKYSKLELIEFLVLALNVHLFKICSATLFSMLA